MAVELKRPCPKEYLETTLPMFIGKHWSNDTIDEQTQYKQFPWHEDWRYWEYTRPLAIGKLVVQVANSDDWESSYKYTFRIGIATKCLQGCERYSLHPINTVELTVTRDTIMVKQLLVWLRSMTINLTMDED
jgi:hypothetical protein